MLKFKAKKSLLYLYLDKAIWGGINLSRIKQLEVSYRPEAKRGPHALFIRMAKEYHK